MIRSKNFLEVPFLIFLALHIKRENVARWDLLHVIHKLKLCLHAKVLGL